MTAGIDAALEEVALVVSGGTGVEALVGGEVERACALVGQEHGRQRRHDVALYLLEVEFALADGFAPPGGKALGQLHGIRQDQGGHAARIAVDGEVGEHVVGDVLILGVEPAPIVGVAVAVAAGRLVAEEELVLRAVLDEDVEVLGAAAEGVLAHQSEDWRRVVAVVHQAAGLHPGVHIERLEARHALEGVVANAVGQLLMDGEHGGRLGCREQIAVFHVVERLVAHGASGAAVAEHKGLLHAVALGIGDAVERLGQQHAVHGPQRLEGVGAQGGGGEGNLAEIGVEVVVDDEVARTRGADGLLDRYGGRGDLHHGDLAVMLRLLHFRLEPRTHITGNGVGHVIAHVAHVRRVERVAVVVAQEHLQLGMAVKGIDVVIAREGVFIIIHTEQHGLLHLLIRARRNLGTGGVAAATIITGASHTVIAVEVEIIHQLLTVTLTGNGTNAIVAMRDDFSAEVTVKDARGVVIALLYLTHQPADLSVGLYSDVAIAVFYAVVVVGHIAADGAKLVVAAFVLPHASSHHGTVGDGAVVVHPAAKGADVTVVSVAGTNVHILQLEVHDFAVVQLAEERAIVVVSFDFQVFDGVAHAVEVAGELVVVVPPEGIVVEVVVVQVDVVHQIDGPAFVALIAVIVIAPVFAQADELGGRVDVDGLGIPIRSRRLCLIAVPNQLGVGDVHRTGLHGGHRRQQHRPYLLFHHQLSIINYQLSIINYQYANFTVSSPEETSPTPLRCITGKKARPSSPAVLRASTVPLA